MDSTVSVCVGKYFGPITQSVTTQKTMCSAGSRASAYMADFSFSASQFVKLPLPTACVVDSSAFSSSGSSISSEPSGATPPTSATIVSAAAIAAAARGPSGRAAACATAPTPLRRSELYAPAPRLPAPTNQRSSARVGATAPRLPS